MATSLCILNNDTLDPTAASTFMSYGVMAEKLLRKAGAQDWNVEIFNTMEQQYPDSFDRFDAVLLTGSKFDSFSSEPWVVELRRRVRTLLAQKKKLLGICFGHQLIAYCMGAKVGRSDKGWGTGRMRYQWVEPDFPAANGRTEIALLASHQDQVLELPAGTRLIATSEFCPVAGYAKGEEVFCVQAHPEFVPAYSEHIIGRRRGSWADDTVDKALESLKLGHEGDAVARMMVAFVQGSSATQAQAA